MNIQNSSTGMDQTANKQKNNYYGWKKVNDKKPVQPILRGLNLGYSSSKIDSKIRLWQ